MSPGSRGSWRLRRDVQRRPVDGPAHVALVVLRDEEDFISSLRLGAHDVGQQGSACDGVPEAMHGGELAVLYRHRPPLSVLLMKHGERGVTAVVFRLQLSRTTGSSHSAARTDVRCMCRTRSPSIGRTASGACALPASAPAALGSAPFVPIHPCSSPVGCRGDRPGSRTRARRLRDRQDAHPPRSTRATPRGGPRSEPQR